MQYLLLDMEGLPSLYRAQPHPPFQLDNHVISLGAREHIHPTDHVQNFDVDVECQAVMQISVECTDIVLC